MHAPCCAHVHTKPHPYAHLAHIMHMWGHGDGVDEG